MEPAKNMPTYVFATVTPGRTTKVVEELKHHNQIDLITPIHGKFDLAIRLKQFPSKETYEEIKKIREVPGIRHTTSHFAFEGIRPVEEIEKMPLGITFMNVEEKPLDSVIREISRVPGLVEAFTVEGENDIVALWQNETTDKLFKESFEKLSNIEGLHTSETLFGLNPIFKK